MSNKLKETVPVERQTIDPKTLAENVRKAKQQAEIRELEVLVGKLTDQNQDYAKQIKSATVEVGRLRNIETEALKFRRMTTLPNGELYYGALFEAIDADGDGELDTHRLIQGAPDTIKLTPEEIKRSELLRQQLILSPQQGPTERDALTFLGTNPSVPKEAQSAQGVLNEVVEQVSS